MDFTGIKIFLQNVINMALQYSLNVKYSKVTLSHITVLCRMENGAPYEGENTAV